MDCRECLDQLHSYIDEEVDGTSAQFLRRHLDACRPCFSRCELEQAFQRAVRRQAASPEMPDGLAARLKAALDREDERKRSPPSGPAIPSPPA